MILLSNLLYVNLDKVLKQIIFYNKDIICKNYNKK